MKVCTFMKKHFLVQQQKTELEQPSASAYVLHLYKLY